MPIYDKKYNEDSEEITLGQLLFEAGEYFRYVLKRWPVFLLITGLILFLFLYKEYKKEKEYKASLTFMLNQEENAIASGGMSSLLQSIGGGGGKNKEGAFAKMIELMKTRSIIEEVLFKKVEINGKKDLLANHLIDSYGFRENEWEDNEKLLAFSFKHGDVSKFNTLERKLFKQFHRMLIGEKLESNVSDGGIVQLTFTGPQEEFTYVYITELFEALMKYYVEKTSERQQENFELVQVRADSLASVLHEKEMSLGRFKDRTRGMFLSEDHVRISRMEREVMLLNSITVDAYKSMEMTRNLLMSSKPLIKLVDAPMYPLGSTRQNWFNAFFMGILLGGFLAAFFLIVWRIISEAVAYEKERRKLEAE